MRHGHSLSALALLLLLSGCAGQQTRELIASPAIAAPASEIAGRHRIFVATTRAEADDRREVFSGGRSPNLHFAHVDMTVPAIHKVGEIERRKKNRRADPAKFFVAADVAGYQDDESAYVYGDWRASSPSPCAELTHSDFEIHEDVPPWKESEFTERFHEPLDTFGTSVTWDHDFTGAPCDASGLYYICYPTIAPSSLTYYKPAVGRAMAGWENSVIMTSLKDGTIYRLALNSIETDVVAVEPLYTDQDRFRATIVSRDGKTVYAITDTAGLVRGEGDAPTTDLTHPGSLLAFRVTN
jgi:hypothetical protein